MSRNAPDRRDGLIYVMPEDVKLAIEVALVTGRPLLLRGEPGSGKSSLASFVARQREWRYYEEVVTTRTQPRDLLWSYDSVRRLADAQAGRLGGQHDDFRYVEPGVLWWALAPKSARRRGRPEGRPGYKRPVNVPAMDPRADSNASRELKPAVVLVDEIDKADPDVPNGLLVPLGSNEFVVSETGTVIRRESHGSDPSLLVVITTNEERELPQAFLRRCVVVWLPEPDEDRLVAIAREHAGRQSRAGEKLAREVARELLKVRDEAKVRNIRAPSIAEFLDALWACQNLGIRVGDSRWERLRGLALLKPQQPNR
jgi:MoxR-like ATPase